MFSPLKIAVVTIALFGGITAPAAADCIKIDGKFYENGAPVDSCKKARPYKHKSETAHSDDEHPKCAGQEPGYKVVAPGPNGRLALITCR